MLDRLRALVVLVTLLVAALSAAPVAAAAPPNDEMASAINVTALPYNHEQNTSEATMGASDPDECELYPGATVWFRHTAAEDGRLEANTFGSDYDTTLYVYVPDGAGGLETIGCSDDYNCLQSRVQFDAQAGQLYLFMIGSYGYEVGGALSFQVLEAPPYVPPDITIQVNPRGRFHRDGSATVSGTLICSGGYHSYVELFLQQRVGRLRIYGWGEQSFGCSGAPVTWRVRVSSMDGVFKGGRATVSANAETCGEEECDWTETSRTIRLRGGK